MDEVFKTGNRLNILAQNNGKEAQFYFMGPTFGKNFDHNGWFPRNVAYYSHPCTNISLVALILF